MQACSPLPCPPDAHCTHHTCCLHAMAPSRSSTAPTAPTHTCSLSPVPPTFQLPVLHQPLPATATPEGNSLTPLPLVGCSSRPACGLNLHSHTHTSVTHTCTSVSHISHVRHTYLHLQISPQTGTHASHGHGLTQTHVVTHASHGLTPGHACFTGPHTWSRMLHKASHMVTHASQGLTRGHTPRRPWVSQVWTKSVQNLYTKRGVREQP